MMLPTPISPSPASAASTVTTSSGVEVPIATIVQSDRELADAEPPRHSNGRVDERASADPQPEDGDDDDPDLNDRRSRGHTITLLGRRQ